jgi:hypothetical protein
MKRIEILKPIILLRSTTVLTVWMIYTNNGRTYSLKRAYTSQNINNNY